ncbi:34155_t:CDS:1, partial [Gigaspora margarita]
GSIQRGISTLFKMTILTNEQKMKKGEKGKMTDIFALSVVFNHKNYSTIQDMPYHCTMYSKADL